MCKVINLFGEPGSGKSTLAAYIYYKLKLYGYNCEYIGLEKYQDCKNDLAIQADIFGKQMQKMNRLKNNTDILITNYPIILCGFCKDDKNNSFYNLVHDTYNLYDNYNFFLTRNHPYVKEGRKYTESQAEDYRISLFLALARSNIDYEMVISTQKPNSNINDTGEHIISKVIEGCTPYKELIPYNTASEDENDNKGILNKIIALFKHFHD